MRNKSFLCSNCFKNYGLRIHAEKLASKEEKIQCGNCNNNGLKITTCKAYELMSNFFVFGSIPPEINSLAPLFQFNEHQHPGKVNFATEIDTDLKLLSDFLHVGLFHYGPQMWRIGHTEHYDKLTSDKTKGSNRKKLWKEIFRKCCVVILEKDTDIFRVRNDEKMPPALPSEFDSPPENYISEGRFHTKKFPLFYGALDIETCLHETRATLADYSMLAIFKPNDQLKLLNIADKTKDINGTSEFERIDIFLEKLAYSGTTEYKLCQEMAREIKGAGFDGFISTSYFGQAHKKSLYNINLFGYPVRDGKINLISTNRIKLTSLSYEYQFGPTNHTNYPLDIAEIKELNDEMLKVAINDERFDDKKNMELGKQLKDLLSRKSNTPI